MLAGVAILEWFMNNVFRTMKMRKLIRIRACFILQLLSMVTTCTGFETPVEGKDHQKIFLVQMVLKSSMRVHKLNVYLMLYYAPSNAICTVFHITHTILTYPVL
ncbi:hypothetical protein NC651_019073 [Populus alba x Populus x berolinensis]|nr:hypothetical protein NC651_019073 [Populus alba x Populus x berolinensis]